MAELLAVCIAGQIVFLFREFSRTRVINERIGSRALQRTGKRRQFPLWCICGGGILGAGVRIDIEGDEVEYARKNMREGRVGVKIVAKTVGAVDVVRLLFYMKEFCVL